MQNMFQTTNYQNINNQPTQNAINQPSQNAINQPVQNKPPAFDMFSNNKPQTFATMSGGGNNEFNMANFGTMQAKPQGDFNFLDSSKPKENNTNKSGGSDLI